MRTCVQRRGLEAKRGPRVRPPLTFSSADAVRVAWTAREASTSPSRSARVVVDVRAMVANEWQGLAPFNRLPPQRHCTSRRRRSHCAAQGRRAGGLVHVHVQWWARIPRNSHAARAASGRLLSSTLVSSGWALAVAISQERDDTHRRSLPHLRQLRVRRSTDTGAQRCQSQRPHLPCERPSPPPSPPSASSWRQRASLVRELTTATTHVCSCLLSSHAHLGTRSTAAAAFYRLGHSYPVSPR